MTDPRLGMSRLLPFTLSIGILALTVVLLVQGRELLIPIALAVLIWYLINAIARAVDHMVPGYTLPHWLGLSVALIVMSLAFWGIGKMIGGSIAGVSEAAPLYQQNLDDLIRRGAAYVGAEEVPTMADVFDKLDLQAIIGRFAESAASVAGRIGIILVYVMFLLLEEQSFNRKLSALFPDREREASVRKILRQIQGDVQTYLALKTMMSVLTGAVSYAVLIMIGVDFAAFWAFVIFLLNFIPTIGSLVGVIFPALLTIIQFNALTPFVIVVVALGAAQFLIGNVLEPKLMGSSLNLSPLVMILSLSLWGQIWGIVGMFLCVPIMVMLMIVLAHLPYTRPVAIAMSGSGRIDDYISKD
jgi:predicted PurR-regulated permease PerM